MTETREARPEANGTGSTAQLTGGTSTTDSTAFVAGLRRRRAASWRCVPRDGWRDPWRDRRPDRWTQHEIESWGAAVEHLAGHGYDIRWCVPVEAIAELAAA